MNDWQKIETAPDEVVNMIAQLKKNVSEMSIDAPFHWERNWRTVMRDAIALLERMTGSATVQQEKPDDHQNNPNSGTIHQGRR